MHKYFIVVCFLVYFINADEVADTNEEKENIQEPDQASSNIQQTSGRGLESGKSFSSNILYPPLKTELGNGYGYIPPQGQFYPVPEPYHPYPYQPHPYFGGSAGYPNSPGGFYQRPPYYSSNYLQSYDLSYGRRSNTA